ncbi:MAG: hypothetical protein HY922_05965 [Elusimicrobia bacterium]|nr:hypothetical protein [Elusimicrobiota bacterium]
MPRLLLRQKLTDSDGDLFDQDETLMKVMMIGIKGRREALREFEQAFEAARRSLPFERQTGVYFTSLEAARRFLTPKRLELIRLIKERRPHSLYELAKLASRAFPGVFQDVQLLFRHGLVKLGREKRTPRNPVHPQVGYDAISLWIGL